MEPINTRDPVTAARAYLSILDWPISVGHRYRPRSGCTCGQACATPGAHPRPGALTPLTTDGVRAVLDAAPGAGLITPTARFDALVMPRQLGMAAMVSLDRVAPVPCLIDDTRAILLVLPSTGRCALSDQALTAVELRAGPDQWIAVPPSHGTRWDTPPWSEETHAPIPLLHGGDLRPQLSEALRSSWATVTANEVSQ
ncbi:hypothetical protein [Streptomyces formicae]|uniref:DNA primase/polymerase bifunctional N-terminal domain-containing protein n=1 Tax=Streptomyces formicae TaxID=1616117 RepID=A0ABY3WYP1_9ACTN|nr:hypothetical protein [Streptomyces formicae]UNM14888.1 hypothetical protein J4032_28540 [Streptomyces formicae]